MAYTINFTDVSNKGSITVEDNTLNVQTSLSFPGRNTTAYGTAINENFLHLLENFAAPNPPANPAEGQVWYDNSTTVNQLKVYDGTNWVEASQDYASFEFIHPNRWRSTGVEGLTTRERLGHTPKPTL